ncbi:MAG: hypothetical protein LBO00_03865 [Zoogloeaceae bacterium]|jgi:hypothetical protein|nr:hypothetical protein [Zoogloeaceae bacterium]
MHTIDVEVECPSLRHPVTVRELTVAEVRAAFGIAERDLGSVPGAYPHDPILGLSVAEGRKISEADRARLVSVAALLNPDLFHAREGEGSDAPTADATGDVGTVGGLESAVARLIAAGHPNAWEYPWGVFKAAVEVLVEDAKGEEE